MIEVTCIRLSLSHIVTDTFWCFCSRRLLKTLGQKEKWLIMCNLPFCHNVFNFILKNHSFCGSLLLRARYSCYKGSSVYVYVCMSLAVWILYGPHLTTSNVKVKLRTQRSKWVLFDRTVSCPGCILSMHHRISKKLGTIVHHDGVVCRAQDPGLCLKFKGHTLGQTSKWVLFDMTVPCTAHIATMHHRIPKLRGIHVHHDEVKCPAQDTGLYLKGQGHT